MKLKFNSKKNKNKNRINNSSNNDNSLEISPEELLDIKYIKGEIKKEENKLNKNISPENEKKVIIVIQKQ